MRDGPGAGQGVQGRATRLLLGFLVLAFCAAPVPGDVGGCNQRAQELDAEVFFDLKQGIDCERCRECRLESGACAAACAATPLQAAFPAACVPLVHDGEVCLRALRQASCDEYGTHMRDMAPTVPTECNFCPRAAP